MQMKRMLDDQPGNRPLVIEELRPYSTLIQHLNDKLPSVLEKQEISVVSICELELTPSIVKVIPLCPGSLSSLTIYHLV